MIQALYINLPVADVARSRTFFTALGFEIEENFSNEDAIAVNLGSGNYAMMLRTDFFQTFTKKPVSDAWQSTEVLTALQLPDRLAVDALVAKAHAAGGSSYAEPIDHGFMYGHNFQDLDGHQWEPFAYMVQGTDSGL